MDSLGSGNIDISQMSDVEKKDLQQFVVNESQKARIQQCMATTLLSSALPFPLPLLYPALALPLTTTTTSSKPTLLTIIPLT
jgi:hypothetical protein